MCSSASRSSPTRSACVTGSTPIDICAIDNTTRKLLQQGKKPYTVGTWFSLGHSTIVMGMLVGLVVAARFILSTYPTFASVGAIVGTAISGGFLYVIALINLLIFWEVYLIFRQLRAGSLDNERLEAQLNNRGFMNRYFNWLFKFVNEPWQIYPVGVLFGLGFDTATEVTLIAITVTVGTAAVGFPLWAVLLLPFLFACGMVLTDTSDGLSMRYAYGWAFAKPIRKVFYNLTLTLISVLVAFIVGTIEDPGGRGRRVRAFGRSFRLLDHHELAQQRFRPVRHRRMGVRRDRDRSPLHWHVAHCHADLQAEALRGDRVRETPE